MLPLAWAIAAVVSRKKQRFNSAASAGRSGGVRRVLTSPGRGAFVMTARAQRPSSSVRGGRAGSRIRWADLILRSTFLAFAAEGVLITAIPPSFEFNPWVCCENFLE